MNQLQIIDERELLGRDFRIYGTLDNPLFLAKDVAEWIEHSNSRMMLQGVDVEEKVCVNNPYALKGQQEQWFLTEDGLYEVLMQSRKPIAKEFKKKVKEILKAIRTNGGYLAGQEAMSDEEIMAKALMVAQKTINNKNRIIEKQQKVIEELQPKASYYDLVLQCKDTIATTIIAKDYGMAPMKFNLMLKEFGIQYKQGETWLLYSKYQGYGYMATKTHNFPDLDGVQHIRVHSYWTQKGRLFLYNFLKDKGILPIIERQEIA